MEKVLFISSVNKKNLNSGINKKILSQVNSLNKFNSKVFLGGEQDNSFLIYDTDYIEKFDSKLQKMINKWRFYNKVIKKENISWIYIRYEQFSSPSFIKFLKYNKKRKIILEIPTYPYDFEHKKLKIFSKLKIKLDKIYRNKLFKYVDKIVTFSHDEQIWGIPCINISNGINLEEIKMIKKNSYQKDIIHFTSVSSCDFWHGIDRFLLSLDEYGKLKNKQKIKFNVVGEGLETIKLKEIVKNSNYLKDVVEFTGFKSGVSLDKIYNQTDIALGCLGNHRKGIHIIQALKNKEYMAKGLPMIFSEDDPGLRNKKFVYRATRDEELINIEDVIKWYKSLEISPKEIRRHAEEFTWDIQMKKVLDNI